MLKNFMWDYRCYESTQNNIQLWRFSCSVSQDSELKKTSSARKYYNNEYDVWLLTNMIGQMENIFYIFLSDV